MRVRQALSCTAARMSQISGGRRHLSAHGKALETLFTTGTDSDPEEMD